MPQVQAQGLCRPTPVADELLQKALIGLHMSEQFVETINDSLLNRAVLFAFMPAFAMSALMGLDEDIFNRHGLFVLYAGCLSASVGLGIFAVIAATMTSAKLSRLLARKQFLFGTTDDISDSASALERLRTFAPHWTDTGQDFTLTREILEAYLAERTTAVLTRPVPYGYVPVKPLTAHGWLGEDYLYYTRKSPRKRSVALAPLRVINLATIAFALSIFFFCCALIVLLVDAMGIATGMALATPIIVAFVSVFVILHSNGSLNDMDVIWKPVMPKAPELVSVRKRLVVPPTEEAVEGLNVVETVGDAVEACAAQSATEATATAPL
jgi:hypothetical protein